MLATIPGTLPQIGTRAAHLRVRRPVPPRHRHLPHRGATGGAGRRGRGTRCCHHADQVPQIAEPSRAVRRRQHARRAPDGARDDDVSKTFQQQRPRGAGARRRRPRPRRRARRSASSASRGRASPRWPRRCSASTPPDAGGQVDARRAPVVARTPPSAPPTTSVPMQMIFQNPDSALNRNWTVRRILSAVGAPSSRASRARRPTRGSTQLAESLRLTPASPRPEAAPAVGRPQAARRDRPCLRRRPAHRRVRRADQRARRVGAGRDPQPARRAAGGRPHELPVHLARPGRGALPRRPHRRDVPRTHHGARHHRRQIFDGPNHPYTEALLSAVPSVDGEEKPRIRLSARSPARPTRRRGACSTPAATG